MEGFDKESNVCYHIIILICGGVVWGEGAFTVTLCSHVVLLTNCKGMPDE